MLKVSRIHRRGFRPAQQRNVGQQRDQRQHYRPEQVNMLDRIQCDPAQHACRGIAAAVRHPRVRRLMHADGEQKRNYLKQDVNMLQSHARLALILTR